MLDQMVHCYGLLFRCCCVIHVCLVVFCECSCSVHCCAVAAAVGAMYLTATDATGSASARGTSPVHSRVAVPTRASLKPCRHKFSRLFRIFCRGARTIRTASAHAAACGARGHLTQHRALHGSAHLLTACENEPFLCFPRPAANVEERTLQRLLTCADRAQRLLACELMLLVESRCPLDVNVVAVVRIRVVFVVFGQNPRPPTFLPLNSKVSEGYRANERSTHQTRHTCSRGSINNAWTSPRTTNHHKTDENSLVEHERARPATTGVKPDVPLCR